MNNETFGDEIVKLLDNIYYQFGEGSHGFEKEHKLTHEQKWVLDKAGELRRAMANQQLLTKTDVDRLKMEIEEIAEERDDLKDELDDLRSENETLRTQIDQLQGE